MSADLFAQAEALGFLEEWYWTGSRGGFGGRKRRYHMGEGRSAIGFDYYTGIRYFCVRTEAR